MAVTDSDYCARIAQEVSTLVGNEAAAEGPLFKEQLFTQWCADLLEESDFIADFQAAGWQHQPQGRVSAQMKIDGFQIDLEERAATIFVTEWEGPADRAVSAAQVERLAAAGMEFLRRSIDGGKPLHRQLEPAHPHTDFSRSLWENRDELQRLGVVVFLSAVSAVTEVPARFIGELPVEIQIWDAKRLVRLLEVGDEPETILIDLVKELGAPLPCLRAPVTDDRYEGYLAVMPAEALARIYDRQGSRVLEQNVRVYLQLSGKVNKGIRKTLLNEPGSFFAYNNGLSATVHDVEYVETGGGRLLSLTGLQIVNGAQTTGSIHRAWREDKSSLEQVYVPVKITRIKPEARQEIADKISSYANSQNSVKAADFSARNPFHVRLEEIARRVWTPKADSHWYYERMRGQYHDEMARLTKARQSTFRKENPPRQKLLKTDVSTIVHIWEKRPDLVCLGAQKNFTKFTTGWLADAEKDWKPDDAWYRDLVAKAILWAEVYAAVRRSEVVGYQSQVAAYIAVLLVEHTDGGIDLGSIWENQAISTPFVTLIESWCRPVYDALVATSAGQDVGMWCRKQGCWAAVRAHLAGLQAAVAPIPELKATAHKALPAVDLSATREQQLKVAREVIAGRVIKREDAVKELQQRFGIARLTNERRAELEGLLEDMTRLAFLDSDETSLRDRGLAIVRAALRAGVRGEAELVKRVAAEWLDVKRVGHKVRAQVDELLVVARHRRIIAIEAGSVSCPTSTFDEYEDLTLQDMIMDMIVRKGRIYSRRAVVEAVVSGLGLVQQRESTLSRIDHCVDALVAHGRLDVPSEGGLRLKAAE